jgi:hypothetical protein
LARVKPMLVHDMERVCALCESKRECDRDLASRASAEHYQEYCLNAPTIAQLREKANRRNLQDQHPQSPFETLPIRPFAFPWTAFSRSGVLADLRPDPAREFRAHRNGFLAAHRSKWDQAAVNHEIMARE